MALLKEIKRMTGMELQDIKIFLDEKTLKYNQPNFIESDPIQIPRRFTNKEDIEIAGFLTAIISWGNRNAIIKNANRLMQLLDFSPYEFITEAPGSEYQRLETFTHRTFNGNDCIYMLQALRNIYRNHGGLQTMVESSYNRNGNIKEALADLHAIMFELPGERTRKHIANVNKGASAKRLNMFLRWMVRNDNRGVDFGLWKGISSSNLMLPLDVHTGNVARKLGILSRKQNDWKAVEEVTGVLRQFDPADPVKYDYALFGLGIFESF